MYSMFKDELWYDNAKPLSFVEKLSILKEDRSNHKDGGISF